eukprot:1489439-Pyramimonas_sp.AAC.1
MLRPDLRGVEWRCPRCSHDSERQPFRLSSFRHLSFVPRILGGPYGPWSGPGGNDEQVLAASSSSSLSLAGLGDHNPPVPF